MKGETHSWTIACLHAETGYVVSCSCGYLVTGWPTLRVAMADAANHAKASR